MFSYFQFVTWAHRKEILHFFPNKLKTRTAGHIKLYYFQRESEKERGERVR